MKKVMLLAGMLLALSAVAANAAGLSLNWDRCASTGRTANKTLACANNLAAGGTLVGSFDVATDVLAATGIEFIVDLASAGATLPQWWVASCAARFSVNATVGANASPSCFDWSGGTAAGGLAAYTTPGPYGPTTARIFGAFAVPPAGVDVPSIGAIVPGGEYFAFNIVLNAAKTSGLGNCAGCLTPVCLVFNNLKMVAGTQTAAILNTAQAPGSNSVTWQGGAGVGSTLGNSCPAATPTRNTTWGSVKSLYR